MSDEFSAAGKARSKILLQYPREPRRKLEEHYITREE